MHPDERPGTMERISILPPNERGESGGKVFPDRKPNFGLAGNSRVRFPNLIEKRCLEKSTVHDVVHATSLVNTVGQGYARTHQN